MSTRYFYFRYSLILQSKKKGFMLMVLVRYTINELKTQIFTFIDNLFYQKGKMDTYIAVLA